MGYRRLVEGQLKHIITRIKTELARYRGLASGPAGPAPRPAWRGLECDVAVFALAYSFFTLIAYHKPLFQFAFNNVDPGTPGGLAVLAGLLLMQLASTFILVLLLSFVPFLVKPVTALLLLCNAAALYFVAKYNVILDRTMMGNVFGTDYGEASALFGFQLPLYLLALGAAPAALLLKVRLRPLPALRKAALVAGTLAAVAAFAYLNSRTWLWFDKNSKRVGGLTMPLSYVGNTIRYYRYQAFLNSVDEKLPGASFLDDDKTTVVLVIGEAARARNFSLYGYGRNTNPLLAAADVAVLPGARSLSTYTSESIRYMLAHRGSRTPSGTLYEALPSYLQRHGVNVLWRSNNWGEPKLKVGRYEKAGDLRRACGAACGTEDYDDVLLYGLKEEIAARSAANNFIVLHQSGSHGPQYSRKYPAEFEVFRPVCKSVDLQQCKPEELMNAYDNSILYTDHFLDGLISRLGSLKDTATVMIYMSDHGESLGEYGFYLHGAPYSLAPEVQKDVPFLVWMSDKFKRRRRLKTADLAAAVPHTQDNVFNSVMGAFGMRSDFYDKSLDIFNPHARD